MAEEKALQMSDEDFLNSPAAFEDTIEELDKEENLPEEDTLESPDKEVEEEESSLEEEPEEELSDEGAEEQDDVIEETVEDFDDTDEMDSSSKEVDVLDEDGDGEEELEEKPTKEESSTTDYEKFYATVTAPFKANGKTMQVQSAEDAIQLMQMGSNYNRKMSALKPQLKVLRMLENHDLLDEDKLSFLIDLNKQDPTAINQLLKDSDIDPADIDLEEDQQYQRSNYRVAESEMDLDTVVSELKDSEYWSPVLDVVTKQWDDESKQIVADKPQLLQVIHNHMVTGVYDIVSTELERERMFGRLNGMTDLEAYEMIGNSLNDSGAFAHLDGNPAQKPAKSTSKFTSNKADDQARREKRRANSPTKRTAKSKDKSDSFNPLALSDEEFSKQFDPRFS